MKIAIHHSEGSFSTRWIEYCETNNIPFKIVNAYDSDIVAQVSDCTAFMWHHSHAYYKDILFAKQLLYSLEKMGLKVFPNFNTTWHFDDKVGQKYLLEAVDAPFVHTYTFYSRKEALDWISKTTFPKVFKLRGGAGSANVKLAKDKKKAISYVNKAFSEGFPQFDRTGNLTERYYKYKHGKDTFFGVIKGIGRLFIPTVASKMFAREKGYVYFQEFLPNNDFDIRVVVIGDKAFALKRLVRKGDFRASGGGNIIYRKEEIDERCIQIAFDINCKLKSQSVAFDFVFDQNNNPLIVELSFGFVVKAYDKCEGFWDNKMKWHAGNNFNFCGWMIDNLLK